MLTSGVFMCFFRPICRFFFEAPSFVIFGWMLRPLYRRVLAGVRRALTPPCRKAQNILNMKQTLMQLDGLRHGSGSGSLETQMITAFF